MPAGSENAIRMLMRWRRRHLRLAPVRLWVLALLIGGASGYGALLFRFAIDAVSVISFGATEASLITGARELSPLRAWAVPVIGGFVVSGLLYLADRFSWLKDGRVQGIAEVIEARAIRDGRISPKAGAAAALVSAVSLGAGASAGREGPAVHLGAAIASFLDEKFDLTAHDRRTLLGCGAAAAVSASFNAPIAGVLFALEVIMGNYALSVFGPIAAASVLGVVVARTHLGDAAAFDVPVYGLINNIDVPLAAVLGMACGLLAAVFIVAVKNLTVRMRTFADQRAFSYLLLPPIGGVLIGAVGVFYPEIFGVSYQAVTNAFTGQYGLVTLLILLGFKIFTTAVTLSTRFGGGVFSPGLVIGAFAGAAYGVSLNFWIPDLAADPVFYAMVGMGALSGAVIGAPISTTLIVFELTGDYSITISLMVAVALSTLILQGLVGKTFFHWQLSRRGYDMSEGPQGVILQTIRIRDVMDKMPTSHPLSEDADRLEAHNSLGEALARLEKSEEPGLPVVASGDRDTVIGYLTRVKALGAYNRALIQSNIEHHR